MRRLSTLILTAALAACNAPAPIQHGGGPNGGPTTNPSGGGGGSGGGGSGGSGGGVGGNGAGPGGGPACANMPSTVDSDGDGYTPAQGDCNDCSAAMNPGAIEIPMNGIDDDCDGMVDENEPACDQMATGKNDPQSMAASIELCDSRFLKSSAMANVMPMANDPKARNVMAAFGTVVKPQQGANMTLISTGLAVDKTAASFVEPQMGTDLGNTGTNPLPNLVGSSNCGQAAVDSVQDYTEWVLTLKAPTNVASFSFQFQFFSAEYPEYVCSMFNDEFLVIVQSSKTYPTPTNISFDTAKNPITVNSGFFTICQNGGTKNTMNCKKGVDQIAGTGYDDADPSGLFARPIGGSTGWLTTQAPIMGGEDITLRFVIFDEGDGIYDSAALIDNFTWGTVTVTGGPTTGPITYRTIKHHHSTPMLLQSPSLMCGA